MPFQKGHKFGKGGLKSPPGGRPPKERVEAKKLAAEMAKQYLDDIIKPLMETYGALSVGQVVTRMTEDGKKEFTLSVDPPTCRDAVGKFIPAAKQQLELSGGLKIVRIDSFKPDE